MLQIVFCVLADTKLSRTLRFGLLPRRCDAAGRFSTDLSESLFRRLRPHTATWPRLESAKATSTGTVSVSEPRDSFCRLGYDLLQSFTGPVAVPVPSLPSPAGRRWPSGTAQILSQCSHASNWDRSQRPVPVFVMFRLRNNCRWALSQCLSQKHSASLSEHPAVGVVLRHLPLKKKTNKPPNFRKSQRPWPCRRISAHPARVRKTKCISGPCVDTTHVEGS